MILLERLKKVREALGKTQKDMASLIDVSLPSWQGYEAGTSVPGGKVFEALVNLGFNGTWLLTGEGEMRRDEKEKIHIAAEGGVDYNAGDPEIREIAAWLKENPGDKKYFIKAIKAKRELKEALEGLVKGG